MWLVAEALLELLLLELAVLELLELLEVLELEELMLEVPSPKLIELESQAQSPASTPASRSEHERIARALATVEARSRRI